MLDKSDVKSWGTSEEPRRQRRERNKLIVRNKKGEVYYGMCFSLNKNSPGFYLDLQDKSGLPLNRTQHILFKDIKAVFYVKSFDGRFNPRDYPVEAISANEPIAIEFNDKEMILGRPVQASWQEEDRFLLMPEERDGNNIMILVERSAVAAIHDQKTYQKGRQEKFTSYVKEHRKPGMSKEECIGDYYFSKRDYKNALRHYRSVREQKGVTETLKKKLCASKYNLGMRHIKQKNYSRALQLMELALKVDPAHKQALRKAGQIREHIAKRNSKSDVEEHNPLH